MLHDVFPVIQSLNLVLQKASGSICLTDISVYLEKTISSLEKLKQHPSDLTFEKIKMIFLLNQL